METAFLRITTPMTPLGRTSMHRMVVIVVLLLLLLIRPAVGQTYQNKLDLYGNILGNTTAYNPAVRPLLDQSQRMNVTVNFYLVSLVTMDDRRQEFVINGFLELIWRDEIAAWNPADYSDNYILHPFPQTIWRPRMILMNTLGDRDLFEDDYSPVIMSFTGEINWYPGSLYPVSCKLNLKKYPFDQQTCHLEMYSMGWSVAELMYNTSRGVVIEDFVVNGEWEIVTTNLRILGLFGLAGFKVEITIQRRSGFFILNIVMPVVLLSFLNIIVFLIPVDSGEKISYGITVLLALSVFMSIVSDMLPRSSDVVPLVTIYLFVLLIISVLTVVVAILIVWLHHKDEKEMKRQKATSTFKNVFKKVKLINRATHPQPMAQVVSSAKSNNMANNLSDEERGSSNVKQGGTLLDAVKKLGNPEKILPPVPSDVCGEPKGNRYKAIGRHIDTISFFAFTLLWISVTLGFILAISN